MQINEGSISFTVCYPFPQDWLNNQYPKINVLMRFLVLYILPLTIIAIFYLKMANYLIISTHNVPGEMQGTQRQVKRKYNINSVWTYNINFVDYSKEKSCSDCFNICTSFCCLFSSNSRFHAVLLLSSKIRRLLQRFLALHENYWILFVVSKFMC